MMDKTDEGSVIERIQFFNGQRLFASDLQGLEGFNTDMRWLHNRSLHQPGVGSGYSLPPGDKGDREVTISPGYAIDDLGREIVLTQNHTEPVPPVADDGTGKPVYYDLTVSYAEELEETETREGICAPRGVARFREDPVFCWVRLGADFQPQDATLKDHIKDGRKILLARAEVFNCRLNAPLVFAHRRNARPASQPYVTCGMVLVPAERWKEDTPGPIYAEIDTSAAGFRTVPFYHARIEFQEAAQINAFVFVYITQSKATSFRAQLLSVSGNIVKPSAPTRVVWMGVEG